MTFIMLFSLGFVVAATFSGIAGIWLLISILWAPFGGLICALRARSLGLPVARFAVVGVAYSLAMLLPWIYLVRRMNGGWFSDGLISAAYILLYTVWAAMVGTIFLFIIGLETNSGGLSWFFPAVLFASVVLPFLWMQLIRRIEVVRIRRSTVAIAYAILYPVCIGLAGIGLRLAADTLGGGIIFLLLISINTASLLTSILVTWYLPDEPEGLLVPFKNILPFALLSLNTVAYLSYGIS